MADSPHLPTRQAGAVVASAARVRLGDRSSITALVRRQAEWQVRCWEAYDAIGEVRYGVGFQADALSKLLLYVGERDPADPDAEPVPTTDPDAVAALDRLRNPATGHAEIVKVIAANLTVAGECFIHGHQDPESGVEDWQVRAAGALVRRGEDEVVLAADPDSDTPSTGGTLLPADDMVARLWLPHPRRPMSPDSPLRGVLPAVEELALWSAASRATARSRLSAGLLLLPDSLTVVPFEVREGETGPTGDPFLLALLEAMTTPLENEDSAAAVVPLILRGDKDALAAVRRVELDRTLDTVVDVRVERAIRRLAQGINLPVEIILGISELSHWGAWQVSADAWRSHLEPFAIAIVSALTTGYLTPALEAAGVSDPGRFVVWYDPQRIIARENVAENAVLAHDRYVISDASLAASLGFSEQDAPDAAELEARMERARVKRPGDPGLTDVPGPPSPDAAARPRPALTAAGDTLTLGTRLAALDRRLADRLQGAADATLSRTLERIGARARAKAPRPRGGAGKAAGVVDVLAGVPDEKVLATLGPDAVAALGLDVEAVLDTAFDRLARTFDSAVASVQRQAAALIPALTASEGEALSARQTQARADAWTWLHAALQALARDRLYDPSPTPPAAGEWDPDSPVPHGLIREALARAGGAGTADDRMLTAGALAALARLPIGALRFGVAVGESVLGELARHGLRTEFWTWSWGGAARPFPAHQALDGQVYADDEDPVLANREGWPSGAYLFPGDHEGCSCSQVPTFG